jgi:hypothetical protein
MDPNPRKEVPHHGPREEREDCAVSVWGDFKTVMGQARRAATGIPASGDDLHGLGDSLFQPNGSGTIDGSGVAQEVPRQWRQDRKPPTPAAFR